MPSVGPGDHSGRGGAAPLKLRCSEKSHGLKKNCSLEGAWPQEVEHGKIFD
jgi:hypothetical protein